MDKNEVQIKPKDFISHISFLPRVENGFSIKRGKVTEPSFIKNSKVTVTISYRPKEGSLIYFDNLFKTYYLARFIGFGKTRKGGFSYELRRKDNKPIEESDVLKINRSKYVTCRGSFENCKKCK